MLINYKNMDFKEYLKRKLEKDSKFKESYERKDYENLVIGIGNQIERERIKNGIKQIELAKKLKTSQSYLSRLENGSLSPSIKKLQEIAEVLGGFIELNISYSNKNKTDIVEISDFKFEETEGLSVIMENKNGTPSFVQRKSTNSILA